jgi:hypothetical protein
MIEQTWRAIRTRFAQSTARERAGIAATAAVFALAMALGAFDWVMQAAAREQAAVDARAEAEAMLSRDGNGAFQVALGDNANKVWRWSIVAQSEGVARAEAMGLVEEIALQAGLTDVEVAADGSEDDTGEIGVIEVRLSASFDWASLQSLLGALETSDTSFSVNAIDVAPSGDGSSTLTMTLAAPYIAEAPP